MAWVVKAWKPEPLQAAEREARRLQRAAGRQAPEPLPIPEKRPAAPAPAADSAPEPQPGEIRATKSARARPSRASMRDSPLSDLFRSTG